MIGETQYLMVVAFDISDNKKRRKITKFLLARVTRVQRSVFECKGNHAFRKKLMDYFSDFYGDGYNIRMYTLSIDAEVISHGEIMEAELEDFYIF